MIMSTRVYLKSYHRREKIYQAIVFYSTGQRVLKKKCRKENLAKLYSQLVVRRFQRRLQNCRDKKLGEF